MLFRSDLPRIKVPLEKWNSRGYIKFVQGPEIDVEHIGAALDEMMQQYNIIAVSIDSYRYALMARMLEQRGFSKANGNLFLTGGRDVIKASPVIESAFANQRIAFGDDPEMRWSVNNAKQISSGIDKDLGNYSYGKIEPKSRKTDSFFAMVQAFACYIQKINIDQPAGDLKKMVALPSFNW